MSAALAIPRQFRLRSFTPILLGISLTLAACNRDVEAETKAEAEANAKKVTADSEADATKPIVEQAFRFRIGMPDDGWKLMTEADARKLNPDAIAGAMHADGLFGIVIVERLPGTTLDQATPLVWRDLPGMVIEDEVVLEYQGEQAKRRTYVAEIGGQRFRYISTVFLHQDHLYQVMSWGMASFPAERLLPFQTAFALLDGEVVGRKSDRAAIEQADGVGWHIADGQFESALSGLRLRAAEGWRYIIGGELDMLHGEAEIALTYEDANAYMAVISERSPATKAQALAELTRRQFVENTGPAIGEPMTYEVAGQKVEFRRHRVDPFEYLHGVYVGDGSVSQISTWYPAGVSESVRAPFEAMLAGFGSIPKSERAALRQQLLATPPSQHRFDATRAYRAGEFLDYGHGVTWREPSGFWRVASYEAALQHSPQCVLFVQELELGVYGALEIFPAPGVAAETVVDGLSAGKKVLSRKVVERDGLTIVDARVDDEQSSPPLSHHFIAAQRGDQMIAMSSWTAGDTKAHEQAMEAALVGLDFDATLTDADTTDGLHSDWRYGLKFTVPSRFEPQPSTPIGLGRVEVWKRGMREELVSMVLVDVAMTDEEGWIASFVEQALRDRVSPDLELGKPERSSAKLGGYESRHLRWKNGMRTLDADIVVRDGIVYSMLYSNVSDELMQEVQQSYVIFESPAVTSAP